MNMNFSIEELANFSMSMVDMVPFTTHHGNAVKKVTTDLRQEGAHVFPHPPKQGSIGSTVISSRLGNKEIKQHLGHGGWSEGNGKFTHPDHPRTSLTHKDNKIEVNTDTSV
jgi:hypothetical protein